MRNVVATVLFSFTCAFAQPTLYIVRHAEKLANWPEKEYNSFQPLSEEGVATAKRLAKHFEKFSFAAIFSSSTTRSLHTAFPLSQKLGVPIDTAFAMRDTSAIDAFYSFLAKKFGPDKSVLLVSHQNIIPYLLIKAGLPKDCFDNMGIHQSMESRWLLLEGYDSIYEAQLGAKQDECSGITRKRY